MHVAVVFNPIAGAGRAARSASAIADAVGAEGHAVDRVATRLEPIDDWLVPALDDVDAMVVVGGDGAVRMAGPAAARRGVPLYHAPLGTENLFAREFGTGREPEHVLAALAARRIVEVDVGLVDRADAPVERFFLMASLGFDADVVHDLAEHRSGAISHLSYARPIVRGLVRWRPSRLSVAVDGETLVDGRVGTVIIGNSRQYACRIDPVQRAAMDDGKLDVVFLPTATRLGLVTWTVRTARRRHLEHKDSAYGSGRTIEVRSEPARRLQLDGDPAECPDAGTAWTFTVAEERLRVLVPA